MTGKRNHPSTPSILLIGATGRAGQEIVNQLIAEEQAGGELHLFCEKQESDQLHEKHLDACTSIYHGDSSRATDILDALKETGANIVILSVDNRDNVTTSNKCDLCTLRAWAVVSAMKMPGMDHTRAIVLSSTGAGSSRIKSGRYGYKMFISRRRRRSIEDHSGQENAFLINGLDHRTVIIRTTDLTDGKPTGEVVEFGDTERAPSFRIDCVDVASYVTKEVFRGAFGKIVNITGRPNI